MASYIIGAVDKRDHEKYALYAEAGFHSIAGMDVEITISEQPETLEGEFPGTTLIMMKFKDDDGAQKWYESEAYQAAIPLRHAAAGTPFMISFTDSQEQG